MLILGIDTSSISCSVGVLNTDTKLCAESFVNNGLTHSQTLLPLIEETIQKAGVTAKDIDLIAVTKGPGSFTGLRIGMATVKGLSAPVNTPCVCVSTLEAIAKTASGDKRLKQKSCVLCAVMDARCNQVYNALFECDDCGNLTRITEDRAIAVLDLENELEKIKKPVFLCGDGEKVCKSKFEKINYNVVSDEFKLPRGKFVCELGEIYKEKAQTGNEISPVYLRLPQASRELLKKKKEK